MESRLLGAGVERLVVEVEFPDTHRHLCCHTIYLAVGCHQMLRLELHSR